MAKAKGWVLSQRELGGGWPQARTDSKELDLHVSRMLGFQNSRDPVVAVNCYRNTATPQASGSSHGGSPTGLCGPG